MTGRWRSPATSRCSTLGNVSPEQVPLWINAANAVLVPSEREGFGLAVLEALACNVPVLATPVGVHPQALDGVSGTLCAPFDADGLGRRARAARGGRRSEGRGPGACGDVVHGPDGRAGAGGVAGVAGVSDGWGIGVAGAANCSFRRGSGRASASPAGRGLRCRGPWEIFRL